MWDFETIDTAEGVDEVGLFEMEPMNELQVETDVKLKSIVKSVDTENEPTIWYAQVRQVIDRGLAPTRLKPYPTAFYNIFENSEMLVLWQVLHNFMLWRVN